VAIIGQHIFTPSAFLIAFFVALSLAGLSVHAKKSLFIPKKKKSDLIKIAARREKFGHPLEERKMNN
jgi:hypothetical protein